MADYTPKDLFDNMSIEKGEFEIVAQRNELRKEIAKKSNDELWEKFRKHFLK